MDRDTRRLQHSKVTGQSIIESGSSPSLDDIKDGTWIVMYIKGFGMRIVARRGGELWYGTLSRTLT
jgi:hypothetical protein